MKAPTHYTREEGGTFEPWTHGEVTFEDLSQHGEGTRNVQINGQTVNALLWMPTAEWEPHYDASTPAWDVINGWRTDRRPDDGN